MKTHTTHSWPALPLKEWEDTYQLLHLMTQVIGKIKLKLTPKVNHWWNVALHITSYGLTTDIIHHPALCFHVDFDLIHHKMIIRTEDGRQEEIALRSCSVAEFYRETFDKLHLLGIDVKIWTQPVEMEHIVHFEKDDVQREYKPEYAGRLWRILLETDNAMRQFRAGFTGKASPVNFFWGSFDMAVTFFSGRPAPEHPGSANVGKQVMVEAYSHELCSFGFWPGAGYGEPAFYAYAYAQPEGYDKWPIKPEGAFYHPEIKEFILPYEAVRQTALPSQTLLAFYKSAYQAAQELGNWDKGLWRG